MGQRTLRLNDVTDVVQGQQMTLCDGLDRGAGRLRRDRSAVNRCTVSARCDLIRYAGILFEQ